jgi:hypothetical protein
MAAIGVYIYLFLSFVSGWRAFSSVSLCNEVYFQVVNRKRQPRKAVSTQTRRPKTHMQICPSVIIYTIVKDHCVLFVRFCGRASPAGQAGSAKPGTSITPRWRCSACYINHNCSPIVSCTSRRFQRWLIDDSELHTAQSYAHTVNHTLHTVPYDAYAYDRMIFLVIIRFVRTLAIAPQSPSFNRSSLNRFPR